MNTILEGLFILFGVPVVILIIGLCWGLVFVGAWELYSKIEKWFEGRKKPEAKPFIPTPEQEKELCPRYFNDAVKPEPTKKEQEIAKELRYFNCPICKLPVQPTDLVGRNECPYCGIDLDVFVILKFEEIDKEIASIKKWLKGRNIPTETKDELRRRLDKI